jgi:hypothetical protein
MVFLIPRQTRALDPPGRSFLITGMSVSGTQFRAMPDATGTNRGWYQNARYSRRESRRRWPNRCVACRLRAPFRQPAHTRAILDLAACGLRGGASSPAPDPPLHRSLTSTSFRHVLPRATRRAYRQTSRTSSGSHGGYGVDRSSDTRSSTLPRQGSPATSARRRRPRRRAIRRHSVQPSSRWPMRARRDDALDAGGCRARVTLRGREGQEDGLLTDLGYAPRKRRYA